MKKAFEIINTWWFKAAASGAIGLVLFLLMLSTCKGGFESVMKSISSHEHHNPHKLDSMEYVDCDGNCENGKGTVEYLSKNADGAVKKVTYIGMIKDSLPDGQGTMTWDDGCKYIGEWKNGKREGKGTMSIDTLKWRNLDYDYSCNYSSCGIYVGEWVDDEMNGQGIFTYYSTTLLLPNGRIDEGLWENGEFIGEE